MYCEVISPGSRDSTPVFELKRVFAKEMNLPPKFSNNPGQPASVRLAFKKALASGIDPYSKMQLD